MYNLRGRKILKKTSPPAHLPRGEGFLYSLSVKPAGMSVADGPHIPSQQVIHL